MKRIESPKNERMKQLKKLHTKKGRDQSRLFLIEGVHLIEEALKYDGVVKEIYVEENFVLPTSFHIQNVAVTYVTKRVMTELSQTETPQGVVAVCRKLTHDVNFVQGTYLLIDRVQDPGNVGTMIRTADAAGLTAVILSEGTVDMYNDKVIRASQGSIFHIPVVKANLLEWVEKYKENIPIFGTSLTNAKSYEKVEKQNDFALIVGNEGEGVSRELLSKTRENIFIPMYGKAESLNVAVATGILLYHLKK